MRKMIDKVRSVRDNAIIVADMSSALGSRDLTKENLWDDLGVVYGGSKTNFGTSGLTFTIIREDVMRRVKEIHSSMTTRSLLPVPIMMDWIKQAETKDYFPNTPCNLAVWLSQMMCEDMLKNGGIEHYDQLADKKSKYLYDFIDNSEDKIMALNDTRRKLHYVNRIDKRLRSRQNVTFNLDCVGEKLP